MLKVKSVVSKNANGCIRSAVNGGYCRTGRGSWDTWASWLRKDGDPLEASGQLLAQGYMNLDLEYNQQLAHRCRILSVSFRSYREYRRICPEDITQDTCPTLKEPDLWSSSAAAWEVSRASASGPDTLHEYRMHVSALTNIACTTGCSRFRQQIA